MLLLQAALMRTSRRTILLSNVMEKGIRPRATISKTKGHSNWLLSLQHELRPAAFHTPYLKDEETACKVLSQNKSWEEKSQLLCPLVARDFEAREDYSSSQLATMSGRGKGGKGLGT